jgi:hypothetical protein
MANSNQLNSRLPAPGPGIGGQNIRAERGTIALATGDLVLNAVHGAFDLPPGFTVLGGAIWATDMDTNGTPLLAFDVGVAGTTAAFFAASQVGRTGVASEALATTGYGFTTTAKTRVIVTVQAAAATAAAGTLNVVLFGTVNEPN